MPVKSSRAATKRRIPVTLVTGFLGSGKTTFINAALRSEELAKTVVVVNEFGEVGLDHQLFASSSDAVVVLENGCLCCTVRSDLVGTLNSLYHARQAGEIPAFDNVVIETSGLADPGPVLQAFLSEPTLDGLYRVASVLTLVDAVNWSGTSDAHEELVRQVALADQIRITKLDMVTGDRQNGSSRMRLDLRRINPSAEIAEVDFSSTAVAKLLTSPGFDTADPQADPRPWLNVQAYQDAADDHDVATMIMVTGSRGMRTVTISKARESRISCSRAKALSRARKCSSSWTGSHRTSDQDFSVSKDSSISPRSPVDRR